jgi:hypothetical protein
MWQSRRILSGYALATRLPRLALALSSLESRNDMEIKPVAVSLS